MSPAMLAVRAGISRGWTEFRQNITDHQGVGFGVTGGLALLAILLLQGDRTVAGTGLPMATFTLPGALASLILLGGVLGTALVLAIEREDGTLLRANAVPHGMVGYLTAKVWSVTLEVTLGMTIAIVPSLFLLEGLAAGVAGWLTLVGILLLGLLATLPWGAMVGSLFTRPGGVAIGFIPFAALALISDIGVQPPWLPEWTQRLAEAFPLYWLGLGMRSALLPDALAAVEVGGSWRPLETVAVLAAWALAGLLLAPVVLRRMARRESGSRLEARRHAAMQRIAG